MEKRGEDSEAIVGGDESKGHRVRREWGEWPTKTSARDLITVETATFLDDLKQWS